MKITVVGSGYVGLVASACFAELGHQVQCVDCDASKIDALSKGHCIIHEQHLPELLLKHSGKNLIFTTRLASAAASSEMIFIAVGTPSLASGSLDLSQVEAVARELGPILCEGYRVVICKSTVPPGSSAWIERILLFNEADSNCFDVAFNPEFLREGTAVADFLFADRIVVGTASTPARRMLRQLYAPIMDGSYSANQPMIPGSVSPDYLETSAISAEMIKNAANSFLAMKISFANAVANLCEKTGADIEEVKSGIGSDRRIGNRFLNAGIGYGGSCFPKDVRAFQQTAQAYGMKFELLESVAQVNQDQRQLFVSKVRQALWTLNGKRLAVLGLAYKGGTDDIRESPAIEIVKALLAEGCTLIAHDPAANERARPLFAGQTISFSDNAYRVMETADALLILTDWKEFSQLNLERVKMLLKYPVVIDGRNLYRPQEVAAAGLFYYSIGRGTYMPDAPNGAASRLLSWPEGSAESSRKPFRVA